MKFKNRFNKRFEYKKTIITKIAAILIALIMLQTLFYKFTAAPESVYVFNKVGLGAIGRIGIGIIELITAILLVNKKTIILGSILSIGVISGAIFFHLTILGIEVMHDKGLLFYLAMIVFVLSVLIIVINKKEVILLIEKVINITKPKKANI